MQNDSFICFDFGLKSIGVAYGSSNTMSAKALGAIRVVSGVVAWQDIDSLVSDWAPDCFVVGLSLHMDGSKQSFHSQLVHFKKSLNKRYEKEVFWADERLTTVAAKEELFALGGKKRLTKKNIDATSAKIILEQWLFERYTS